MKKIGLIGILALFCVSLAFANNYPVYNWTDLQNVNNGHLNDNVYLMKDLKTTDADYATVNGGPNGFNPISVFTGNFDGQNHTITGLYINRSTTDYVGLFGNAGGTQSDIKNVGLENVNISGRYEVGGVVGYTSGPVRVSNSYVTGTVTGSTNDVGGLIGNFQDGVVNNSYADCTVTGLDKVGGLIGYMSDRSYVINSYSSGRVFGTGSYVGGLAGQNSDGFVIGSYWDNETSGQSTSSGGTGEPTEDMMKKGTFVGWDFDNIWDICPDNYPHLQWEGITCQGEEPPESIPEFDFNGSSFAAFVGIIIISIAAVFFMRKR